MISYDCAVQAPCAVNGNVSPAFTRDEVERVRSLIKPYVDTGILCGFGYREGANNILAAHYAIQYNAACEPMDAFTLIKRPNGGFIAETKAMVPVSGYNATFAEAMNLIDRFLSVYSNNPSPALTPFNKL